MFAWPLTPRVPPFKPAWVDGVEFPQTREKCTDEQVYCISTGLQLGREGGEGDSLLCPVFMYYSEDENKQ